jgi:hypothetical protein
VGFVPEWLEGDSHLISCLTRVPPVGSEPTFKGNILITLCKCSKLSVRHNDPNYYVTSRNVTIVMLIKQQIKDETISD